MYTHLILLILVLIAVAAWWSGAFAVYQMTDIGHIEDHNGVKSFKVTYSYKRFPGATVVFKKIDCYMWDGDTYINDGYATPLQWLSQDLADQVENFIYSLV